MAAELPNDNKTALLTATFRSRDGVLPSIWSNSSSEENDTEIDTPSKLRTKLN